MPAGRFAFPGLSGRVAFVKRRASTHSGGTAPDSYRTSLLCPWWAPKAEEELYHKPSHKSQVTGHKSQLTAICDLSLVTCDL
jgi:hypothetical protein